MTYRFVQYYRTYAPGDPVPEGWNMGIVGTLLARGAVEAMPEKPFVPENKAIEAGRVKTKGVASDEPDGL